MKKANKKLNAAIVIIGNEVLSGRTQDVNVLNISNWLNELGVKLEEVRVIPDVEKTIVKTYLNFFLTSLTVAIIIFSISGITLTSASLMPKPFSQFEILNTLTSCVLPDKISLPIIIIAAFNFLLAIFII